MEIIQSQIILPIPESTLWGEKIFPAGKVLFLVGRRPASYYIQTCFLLPIPGNILFKKYFQQESQASSAVNHLMLSFGDAAK